MECKVEKFQMSPCCTALTLSDDGAQEKTHKVATVLQKRSGQFIEVLPTEPPQKDRPTEECEANNVAFNLCPDGSKVNISINGTTLIATKTSLNVTIGKFTINVGSSLIIEDAPTPSLVAVVSVIQGTPLHIVMGDSPDVGATLSFSKLNC